MAVTYYLGPWVWDTTNTRPGGPPGFWRGPAGTVCGIDLRPDSALVAGPTASGFGLFAVDTAIGGVPSASYTDYGSDPQGTVTLAKRTTWRNNLGIAQAFNGTKLSDILSETLLDKSDPTATNRAKPLGVTRTGELEIHFGPLGGGRIFNRAFGGTADTAWARIQIVEQNDYRAIRLRCLALAAAFDGASPSDVTPQGDPTPVVVLISAIANRTGSTFADVQVALATAQREKFRRYLGWLILIKYKAWSLGVSDLVPSDILSDANPLDPQTTLTDTFTDTDGTGITSHTAGGFSWASPQGSATITSNAAVPSNFWNGRADSALSSSDHYCQADVNNHGDYDGVSCRVASSGLVRYFMVSYFGASGSCQGGSAASDGTPTRFIDDFTNCGASWVAKLDVTGSTLTGYRAGVQRWQTTNTTITGNLYTGLYVGGFVNGSPATTFDNFSASDGLGGAGPVGHVIRTNQAVRRAAFF